ncbi:MAG TPA: 2Fe-2S iron-sulfur cluster-binding protein, partial [Acidimicrobiales bacterium]|nr:2Fe-2S iron-sulfur cluster-binding protein [Acidimicrobiales bacterium]
MADDAAAAPEEKKSTFTVTVDGRAFEANPGQLLIAAAEEHGTYIPRFCWHPRMKPVGMCRMCLVEVEGPRGKALQP